MEERTYIITFETEAGQGQGYYYGESEVEAIVNWEGEMDAFGHDYASIIDIEEVD